MTAEDCSFFFSPQTGINNSQLLKIAIVVGQKMKMCPYQVARTLNTLDTLQIGACGCLEEMWFPFGLIEL